MQKLTHLLSSFVFLSIMWSLGFAEVIFILINDKEKKIGIASHLRRYELIWVDRSQVLTWEKVLLPAMFYPMTTKALSTLPRRRKRLFHFDNNDIKCVPSTIRPRNSKHNDHFFDRLWISGWGNLAQGTHMIIRDHIFSEKLRSFLKCFPSTRKRKDGVFRLF